MGWNKKLLIVPILFVVNTVATGQDRYVVSFSDKANSTFSVNDPLKFLSQRALDRRAKSGVEISEQDFPVNKNYLDSLVKYDITPRHSSRWFNAALVEATADDIATIGEMSFVLSTVYVAPGVRHEADPSVQNTNFTANIPNTSNLSSDTQLEMIGADQMHIDGYTGEGLWVAVFDGGFRGANETAIFQHLFDNGKIKATEDIVRGGKDVFAPNDDHGTQVLSSISAKYESQLRGAGYDADISLYVTEDYTEEYKIEEFNWAIAAEKADSSGVDIINSSLGYDSFYDDSSMNYSPNDLDGQTAVITKAAEMASDRGILVVSASGNELSRSVWDNVSFPSDGPSVLTVGSVTNNKSVSTFSMSGPTADGRIKPDVAAMGSSTVVVGDTHNIRTNSGTSFSSPLIAGFAAGLWQAHPELTNFELKELILRSADNYYTPDNDLGYGIPNYNEVGNILSIEKSKNNFVQLYPNPVSGEKTYLAFTKELTGNIYLTIYNADGNLILNEIKRIDSSEKRIELDLTNLPAGVYVLRIIEDDTVSTLKFVKP